MTLANFSQAVALAAHMTPERIGASDLERSMTFETWDRRASRLGECAFGPWPQSRETGLRSSPSIASSGWRFTRRRRGGRKSSRCRSISGWVAEEMRYIIDDCGARILIVQDALIDRVAGVFRSDADSLRRGPHTGAARARLRGSDRPRLGSTAGGRRGPGRYLDAHVHLGHDGQSQRRHPLASSGRAAVADHRGRARLQPSGIQGSWSCP